MTVLMVGVSHKTAPVAVLEELAVDAAGAEKLLLAVHGIEHVLESAVLATCNRIEVYAAVERFHGSVEQVSRLLCELSPASPESVVPHLDVHYDDGAIAHLFQVAAGLDSMVVGEGQILAQVRDALRLGQETGTIGASLNTLFQQSLRVGKRARAETGIDRVAPSLVTVGLDRASAHVGPIQDGRALVVGAGAMASLAVSTLARMGPREIVVLNRDLDRARRLAGQHGARAGGLADLRQELSRADVVISCTGSLGGVVDAADVAAARGPSAPPLALVDLALPHDVDRAVAGLDGVALIGLSDIARQVDEAGAGVDAVGVRRIVNQEVGSFLSARAAAHVTPTVVALRSMATGVVETEVARLLARVPDLDAATRAEVEYTVRRVADKLLHQPTVRVKELANEAGAVSYATALADLFSLDPASVEAVTRVEGA